MTHLTALAVVLTAAVTATAIVSDVPSVLSLGLTTVIGAVAGAMFPNRNRNENGE